MPEHGEYDQKLNKWFCSYWMTEDKWIESADYCNSCRIGVERHDERPKIVDLRFPLGTKYAVRIAIDYNTPMGLIVATQGAHQRGNP